MATPPKATKAPAAKTTTPAPATTPTGITEKRLDEIRKNAIDITISERGDVEKIKMSGKEELLWAQFRIQAMVDNSVTAAEAERLKAANSGVQIAEPVWCMVIKCGKPVYEDEEPNEWQGTSDYGLRGRQLVTVQYEDGTKAVRVNRGFLKETVEAQAEKGQRLPRFVAKKVVGDQYLDAEETVSEYYVPYNGKLTELAGRYIKRRGTNIRFTEGDFENWEPSEEEEEAAAEKSDSNES